jgi:hypothetical protein
VTSKPRCASRRHYLGQEVFASLVIGVLSVAASVVLMAIISSLGAALFDVAERYSFLLLAWAVTASWVAWVYIGDASSAPWRQLSDSERERWLGVDE